jgi:hypothetical protein
VIDGMGVINVEVAWPTSDATLKDAQKLDWKALLSRARYEF